VRTHCDELGDDIVICFAIRPRPLRLSLMDLLTQILVNSLTTTTPPVDQYKTKEDTVSHPISTDPHRDKDGIHRAKELQP